MDFNLLLSILSAVIVLIGLFVLKKKNVGFSNRTFIALALGVLFGYVFSENVSVIEPIGKIYISLIRMMVIPLVMVSLIRSISNIEDSNKLKEIGIKVIAVLLGTTGIAALVGILFGKLFNVGNGIVFSGAGDFVQREVPGFMDVLNDMLPTNVAKSIVDGQIIPVIIFSIFIAIGIIIEEKERPEAVKTVKNFINEVNNIFIRITRIVLQFTPYGVFALISSISANNGISTLLPLAKFIIAIYLACIFQMIVVHGGLIALIKRKNPLKFFKGIYPAQVVAFTTQSSFGTLPVTIECLEENVKVSPSIASFVASLGSTVGMNGCGGIYPTMVAIFVANVFGIELTLTQYVLLVLTIVIGSIGIAGVPGAATMSTTLILTTLGLPVEGLAIVLGVDVIVDMVRTLTNVTGSAVAAYVVDKSAE